MKEYINKKVFMAIKPDCRILNFTGIVKEVTDLHIIFTDKFGDTLTYRIADIIEIKPINGEFR